MSFARVRALAVVGALVVCALILVTMAFVRDRQSGSPEAKGCSEDAVVADLRLPLPEEVKLRVYNATDKADLAKSVGEAFENRKFQVLERAPDPLAKRVNTVAVLRYGPKGVGSAWLIRAYFLNEAKYEFDINRKDEIVDVVIGTQYKQLATTTEVNQALGQVGSPVLPEGTCAGDE